MAGNAAAGPPPSHGGMRKASAGDVLRTLAVILIPILAISFLLTRNPEDAPVRAVDWQPVLAKARADVEWPVLAPVNLPEGWVPTRVEWLREGQPGLNDQPSPANDWRLGYLSPQQIYFELNQSDGDLDNFVVRSTRSGAPDGVSQVEGEEWQRLVSADGRTRALARRADGVATVVVADAGYEALAAYASTLRG